jgi:uncharacterized spore protein YtfJ
METQQPGADALATRHGANGFIHEVAERLADSANVRTVYGEPVDRNGITVIPVANVRYGFGGGSGRQPAKGQEGTGGGAGVQVSPVGYIEMSQGKVKFRRIRLGATLLRAFGIGMAALVFAREIARAVSQRGREGTPGKLGARSSTDSRRVASLGALLRALPPGERRRVAGRLKALRRP